MSLQDASFLQLESPVTPTHIALLMTFTHPKAANSDFIRKLFNAFLNTRVDNPPFNYRLKNEIFPRALPRWELDCNVDLAYHLRHEAVIQPGGERELGLLISRLHSSPLDRGRPLWEMTLIEGLSGCRFAIYFKMHHALADGVRLLKLVLAGLSGTPGEALAPPWAISPSRERDAQQGSTAPNEWPDFFRSVARDIGQGKKIAPALSSAPVSVLNGPITGQRRLATQRLSLERVKLAAKAADATVNDVVLAVCGGALRTYLLGLQALPEEALVAGIPVALPHHDDLVSGNALGGMTVYLATDIDDPLLRLQAIKNATSLAKAAVKRMPNAMNKTIGAVTNLVNALPVSTKKQSERKPVTNLTISNVPGPQQSLYLQGALMESIFPATLLMPGQRLSIMLVGYRGELHFGFVGCPDYLPHVQKIAELLPSALEELPG